jgi:hypothetical protein
VSTQHVELPPGVGETMLSPGTGLEGPLPASSSAGDKAGPERRDPARKMGPLQILRLGGAVTLLVATGSFLFRDWETLNSVPFYVQLLLTTVLLSVAGVACGAFLREAKGARTFLAIALYAVPLNFAALGGLVLVTDVGAPLLAGSILLTTGVASLVLGGVAWVGLRALARPHARSLWLALMGGCLLLLVPSRELNFVTPALGAGLVLTAVYQRFSLGSSVALNTFEGWLARVAVVVPVALLGARTVIYYSGEESFFLTLFSGASVFAWVTSGRVESPTWRSVLDAVALTSALVACCVLPFVLNPILGDASAYGFDVLQYGWAVVGVSFGAVLGLMGVTALRGRRFFTGSAGVVAVVGMGISLLAYEAAVSASLTTILVAAAVIAFGYSRRSSVACGAGLLLAVGGCVGLFIGITEFETLKSWPTFAVLGALAIVTASVIERKGAALKRSARRLRSRFA